MGKQEPVRVMEVLSGLALFCVIAFVFWHAGIAVRLEFSSSQCQDNLKFLENPIEKTEWLGAATLQVQAYGVTNCCNKIGKGEYEIRGNTILLKYQDKGNDSCNCMCGHNLIYTFHNLPKKDYQFKLQAVSVGDKAPLNWKWLFLTD